MTTPKTIWVPTQLADDLEDKSAYIDEVLYVRSDVVDELRKALAACALIISGETLYKSALIEALEKTKSALDNSAIRPEETPTETDEETT